MELWSDRIECVWSDHGLLLGERGLLEQVHKEYRVAHEQSETTSTGLLAGQT
jgi:hypothetical protein